MSVHTVAERAIASVLAALLISCGATRPITPTRAEELTHLVLFIREQPDGTVTHSWQRAEEVDLSRYRFLSSAQGVAQRIVLAVGRPRDCDEENRECLRECMSRPLPKGLGHITSGGRGRGGKEEYCRYRCWQPYRDCLELQKLRPQEFTSVDTATDWLKRNHKSILLGSVVVIAGVAFVVISAGAGLVILAPTVLLATPSNESELYTAEVSP